VEHDDNPYAAPSSFDPVPAASLSRLQRRFLTIYCRFHQQGVRFGVLFSSIWKSYLVLFVYVVIALAFLFAVGLHVLGTFLIGLTTGVLLRDFGAIRMTRRIWPVLDSLIDWDRAEQLLKE
jgi:hypothetical protein